MATDAPFRARFPGWCHRCDNRFGKGVLVRFDETSKRYVHKECPAHGGHAGGGYRVRPRRTRVTAHVR